MFGPNRNELDSRAVKHVHKVQVHALLAMLDEVPAELIDPNAQEYLEFSQCRAVLATKLPAWNLGDISPASDVGGKDVIERVRHLMLKCRDQLPPPPTRRVEGTQQKRDTKKGPLRQEAGMAPPLPNSAHGDQLISAKPRGTAGFLSDLHM
jgi:hypothetical protein